MHQIDYRNIWKSQEKCVILMWTWMWPSWQLWLVVLLINICRQRAASYATHCNVAYTVNTKSFTGHMHPHGTHTHTHPFNGPFPGPPGWSGTRKVKTNLEFTETRDSEWQWHQLDHMQVCTSFQTDNHASTPPLSFLQAGCPSCHPTNSVKGLKG